MLRVGMMTEKVLNYKDLKQSLKMIKDLGYECADLTLFHPTNYKQFLDYFDCEEYKEKAKEIKEYAKKIDLPIVQSHAPFPVYRFGDKKYNKDMFNTLIKCIEICGIIGIKNLVIHPFNDFTDEENIDFYNKLIPYAKENNVIICCENMWRWDDINNRAKVCACSLPDSFANTIDSVNSPYLKACVDIGHAEMFSYMNMSARKMLEEMDNRVYCLHIHDNDKIHDNHKVPFTAKINFNDVAIGLKNINYKYDLILETVLDKHYKFFFSAKRFWKRQVKVAFKIKEMIIEK